MRILVKEKSVLLLGRLLKLVVVRHWEIPCPAAMNTQSKIIHISLTWGKFLDSSVSKRSAGPGNRLPPPVRTTFPMRTCCRSGWQAWRDSESNVGIFLDFATAENEWLWDRLGMKTRTTSCEEDGIILAQSTCCNVSGTRTGVLDEKPQHCDVQWERSQTCGKTAYRSFHPWSRIPATFCIYSSTSRLSHQTLQLPSFQIYDLYGGWTWVVHRARRAVLRCINKMSDSNMTNNAPIFLRWVDGGGSENVVDGDWDCRHCGADLCVTTD